jgi:hypothetical protein
MVIDRKEFNELMGMYAELAADVSVGCIGGGGFGSLVATTQRNRNKPRRPISWQRQFEAGRLGRSLFAFGRVTLREGRPFDELNTLRTCNAWIGSEDQEQIVPVTLPPAAIAELKEDMAGLPQVDPGIEAIVAACTDWLCVAQDRSLSNDGGVARDFSLLKGWSTSYPETTGYIIRQ